ncbi:hypothetical protein J2I47_20945 [Fibrella sp. HMF5335]|uniref:Uncharacterized protein n=1 Tax=Fibrella rubiginis TaxID=2817060 RepID=A0A939GHB8_9BACT|nr:hypothetical protein [Fibrella rubiginis]MBO0939034.1 hypothetical protein [Fibrella rubiginis]
MKTLTRHLLYSATFLVILLFIAGLTLFREAPVAEIILSDLALIATVLGVGWASSQLNRRSRPVHTDSAYRNKRVVSSASELVDQD